MTRFEQSRYCPSLAYPIYDPNTATFGSAVPGFPEIGTNWWGFYHPTFHCLGMRFDLHMLRSAASACLSGDPNLQDVGNTWLYVNLGADVRKLFNVAICYYHEEMHSMLANTLIPTLIARVMVVASNSIFALCRGEEVVGLDGGCAFRPTTPIEVPMTGNLGGSFLELMWELARRLTAISQTVQEVFAVWRSLDKALGPPGISEQEQQAYETGYRKAYGKYDREFPRLYRRFKSLASRVNYDVAVAIVTEAMYTLEPTMALNLLIIKIGNLLDKGEKVDRATIQEIGRSLVKALRYSESIANIHPFLEHPISQVFSEREHQSQTEVLRRPESWLLFDQVERGLDTWVFYEDGMIFNLMSDESIIASDQGKLTRADAIWAESMRQQLVTGDGIRCPFWRMRDDFCCGRRDLLKGLFKNTIHTGRQAAKWQLCGCVREK